MIAPTRAGVLLALDTDDTATALGHAKRVGANVAGIKLGLEFFCANGPEGVRQVASSRRPLFLDLKFHDIPATVRGAVASAARLKPFMMTVHASGGGAMMRAAATAAAEAAAKGGFTRPALVAVTVLTSLSDDELATVGQNGPALDQVRRLAALAQAHGMDGVVCSPREAAVLRQDCGQGFLLVTPGVRPSTALAGDQRRVATPGDAVRAGANYLVIGRPILAAPDPAAAARAIAADIAAALA
jgi:orotidine-5'-phosphate decarboxylase